MNPTQTVQQSETLVDRRKAAAEQRSVKPVKWWAVLGAANIAIFAALWVAWIASGNFQRTPSGPTPIPEWHRIAAYVNEVLAVGLFVACLYFYVFRPWRRTGSIGFDGLMYLAFLTLMWQDSLSGIFRISFLFSTAFHQWGSWNNFLPGWIVPHGNLVSEPLLFEWVLYSAFFMPGVVFANYLMRRTSQRWPRMGKIGIVAVSFGVLAFVDFVLEYAWLRLGLYAFPGSIRWLTLHHGRYYQFPIYEVVFLTSSWVAFACVRYFKNDKGQTVVERGIDDIRVSARQKSGIRFLALAGILNVILLVTFNIPWAFMTMVGDTWPADITKRSYILNGLCGPGTDYSCPSLDLPIPHRRSAYVNNDGQLVTPAESKLPHAGSR